MFAVIQKSPNSSNDDQNNKSIIGFIEQPQDLLEFVKKEINDDNYIYLTNVPLNEILNEKIFKNNKYLISYNDTKIIYVDKIITIERGYIYNSRKIDINVLNQWKTVENKVTMHRDYYYH